MLIAVPNVSEGRDERVLAAIGAAFADGGARVLDVHRDPDHHRAVFTLAAPPGRLAPALARGAAEAVARIDLTGRDGIHPHVGAVDVVPIVHMADHQRGAACAEALVAGEELGGLGLPVLLYGALAGGRTRAELRRGGPDALARRLQTGELSADFGPAHAPHPTAGATLVAARAPLIAFNLELAPGTSEQAAKAVAATVREGGPQGLPGVRALGLWLATEGVAQVSCNVEDHHAVPLARLIEAVRAVADVTAAEVVGLPPSAAFADYPEDLPTRNRRALEDVLTSSCGR